MARYYGNLQNDLEAFAQYMYTKLNDSDKVLCTLENGSAVVKVAQCVWDLADSVVDEAMSVYPDLIRGYDPETGYLFFPNAHRASVFMRFYRRIDDTEAEKIMREYVHKLFSLPNTQCLSIILCSHDPIVRIMWEYFEHAPLILLRMVSKLPYGMITKTPHQDASLKQVGFLDLKFRSRKWAEKFYNIFLEGRPK